VRVVKALVRMAARAMARVAAFLQGVLAFQGFPKPSEQPIWKDRRAISDAVAVALLLTMAIVMAAAIGAVALSKAPTASAPVAQLSIHSSNGKIVIDHLGGDAIDPGDMRIVVYNLPSGTVLDSPIDNPTIDTDVSPTGVFNVGDKIILDTTDLSNLTDGQYTVKVIFVPLSKPIAESNVFVSS